MFAFLSVYWTAFGVSNKYCGVPGSPCLSKTGLILAAFFNFQQSVYAQYRGIVCICLVQALRNRLEAPHQCQAQSTYLRNKGVSGPCLAMARSQGGSSETLPCWHATVYNGNVGVVPRDYSQHPPIHRARGLKFNVKIAFHEWHFISCISLSAWCNAMFLVYHTLSVYEII